MNNELLQKLGLSSSQAAAYLKLVEKGELSPPELSAITKESRTNTYMILQKLEEYGLIESVEINKKLYYKPLNPMALEHIAEKKKEEMVRIENDIKHSMPQMLSYYYSFTEKPGIRMLQGVSGLKEIYQDTLRTKEDVYFIRTPVEVKTLGEEYISKYKQKRSQLGITTYAITQNNRSSKKYSPDDKLNRMIRTWIRPEDYDAPVEINLYGDKVAFMVFGKDIMGFVIQSPLIAEAMRQIFQMIQRQNK